MTQSLFFQEDDLIRNESIRCRVSEKISRKNIIFDDASRRSSLKVIDHASRHSRRVNGGFYFQTRSVTKRSTRVGGTENKI